MKFTIRVILSLFLTVFIMAGAYVFYVFHSYERLEDNLPLEVTDTAAQEEALPVSQPLSLLSYNVGFGAYSDDYSFFMDGGQESRARSPEAVRENLGGALSTVQEVQPDLILFQEVDVDGDRSHHIDETALVKEAFPEHASVFAQNYDSTYLIWPISDPHGANRAGTMTLSRYPITSALRRSLPIETGAMKIVDLDRCYSLNRIPTSNGKELILVNFHLSAYTSDGSIAEEQLEMLFTDLTAERAKGNYVIAGGDFNKDLLGNSPEVFGVSGEAFTWAQPIPAQLIPDSFTLVAPLNEESPVASCRNADHPLDENSFLVTVDGFLVSDNVEIRASEVVDTGFRWSDHNPVTLEFLLK